MAIRHVIISNMHDIYMRIKTRLLETGVTQRQVALVLGINHTGLSHTLKGRIARPPDFEEKVNAAIDAVLQARQKAQEVWEEGLARGQETCRMTKSKPRLPLEALDMPVPTAQMR